MLNNYPPDAEEVYVPRRLSANLATQLLQRFPKLKRILVPQSIYKMTSKRVLEALAAVGVEVIPTGRSRGRPPKYSEDVINEVCTRYTHGESASKIARDMGIPERTVYYILSRRGLVRR
ncbi:MAG: hypothetical protein PWQ11_104 [Candidatus Diapherotrites archaeon]|nr:hypothetical protein [Candidatus Diapherotrites archaeon]